MLVGPNGAGKSTLAMLLAGKKGYEVLEGKALFQQTDLLALSPEERVKKGLFVAFQQSVSIPGVRMINFLKLAVNEVRTAQGLKPLTAGELLTLARAHMKELGLDEGLLYRGVNEDFSGGEKKRSELLQMALLKPKLMVLDEIDSGLDIEGLQQLGKALTKLKGKDNAFIIITHYTRLLQYITPDAVHVLKAGRLVRSGNAALARHLLEKGYEGVEN